MWERIKKIFKRKPKTLNIPKMDFSDIKFIFNIKSICYFEKLSGKSFFTIDDEDIMLVLYSIYMVNNPDKKMKKEIFFKLLEREEVFKWMVREYTLASMIWQQFVSQTEVETKSSKNEDTSLRMLDYAMTLIIEYGMDAKYVFYEMDMWELGELFTAIENKIKKDAIEKRFWSYINIMPHIDTKKCKSPESLIPYEWEKETIKKRKENDINKNMYAIKNTIGRSIFGDKEV